MLVQDRPPRKRDACHTPHPSPSHAGVTTRDIPQTDTPLSAGVVANMAALDSNKSGECVKRVSALVAGPGLASGQASRFTDAG
ncbi:MAG: hypothetical protein RL722_1793, partial [Pseudomonadota bacterium]